MENSILSFLKEPWFWAGFFGVAGSLGSILIREILSRKSQLNLERLRLHENELLMAYKKLYSFVSHAEYMILPPENPRRDFITVMKGSYKNDVKPNMLLFSPEIRTILYKLESQYECLGNPDFIPEVDFEIFIDSYLHKYFKTLRENIEKRTDSILH